MRKTKGRIYFNLYCKTFLFGYILKYVCTENNYTFTTVTLECTRQLACPKIKFVEVMFTILQSPVNFREWLTPDWSIQS